MNACIDCFEPQAKSRVQRRGAWYLLLGTALAAFPAVGGPLLDAATLNDGWLSSWAVVPLTGIMAVGLPLSPVVLAAGVIDMVWPRP